MSESTAGFRSLIAWQKAQALALAVIVSGKERPPDSIANVMRIQLVRAAGSIPANIAEGYGRYSAGAYRNHLSIARGSLFEAETWIDLMHNSRYLTDAKNRELIAQCSEVGRLLTALMKGVPQSPPRRLGEEPVGYDAGLPDDEA